MFKWCFPYGKCSFLEFVLAYRHFSVEPKNLLGFVQAQWEISSACNNLQSGYRKKHIRKRKYDGIALINGLKSSQKT